MNNKIVLGVGMLVIVAIAGIAVKVFLFSEKATPDQALKTSNGTTTTLGDTNATTTVAGAADTTGDAVVATPKKAKNIVLVVDDSGSMAESVSGQSKTSLAKTAADKFIAGLTEDVNLSIVVYGHKGDNTQAQKAVSCKGIEEVYTMGKINDAVAQSRVNKLMPNGWTPIADSLVKAKEILAKNPGDDNSVVLLSDGEETCGGDPVTVARDLCSNNIKTQVIGLGVSGTSEKQLTDIATNGCGQYFSVNDSVGIQSAFINVGGGAVDINTFNSNVNISADGAVQVKGAGGSVDVSGGKVDIETSSGASVKTGANGGMNLNVGGTSVNVPGF